MIARASDFLASSGFTLPLVGADHPLRKAFHRTFALSALLAMLIHGAVAGGRLGADSLFKKPVTKPAPALVSLQVLPAPRLSEDDVVPAVSLAERLRTPAVGSIEPVPDFEAKEFTIATTDEMAEVAGMDLSSLARSGDAIVVAPDEAYAAAGDYEAVEESPALIHLPRPDYPQIARVAGVEGVVLLQLLIGEDGRVEDVRILDGPEMLREAAVTAAKQGRFRPAQNQGRPVAAWVQVPMRFSLRG